MSQPSIFDSETPLPSDALAKRDKILLGFSARYARVHDQLRLLLNVGGLGDWNRKHHGGKLAICDLVAEQYPLVIFHGDVGTGKTAMAECIANKLVAEAKSEDSILFKLSNRVRGSGMVGEMGTLIAEAFRKVVQSAGKHRRAILVIDEGDSLGASRAQDHSHHEDKVAVNTLIQGIDDLRQYGGRIVVILCTTVFQRWMLRSAGAPRSSRSSSVPPMKSGVSSLRWISRVSAWRPRSSLNLSQLRARAPAIPPGPFRTYARASIRPHLRRPIRKSPCASSI